MNNDGQGAAQIARLIASRIGSTDRSNAWNNPQGTTTLHFGVNDCCRGSSQRGPTPHFRRTLRSGISAIAFASGRRRSRSSRRWTQSLVQ